MGEFSYRVVGVPGLDAELGQDPDAVGEFEGLVQHVLALHVPLGNGVDVVALQFARHRVCETTGEDSLVHYCWTGDDGSHPAARGKTPHTRCRGSRCDWLTR